MKKIKNIFKKVFKYLIIFIISIILFFPFLTQINFLNKNRNEIDSALFSEEYFQYGQNEMHIVKTIKNKEQKILYIHGSPGSLDVFTEYTKDADLNKKYQSISIDRIGYGKTSGAFTPYLKGQAMIISEYLKQNDIKVNIVAHSYGGPVALEVALLAPDNVDSILLISPTLSSVAESKKYWKTFLQNLVLYHAFKYFISKDLIHSSMEMKQLRVDALTQELELKNIKNKITIIHGDKDFVADVSNVDYLQKYATEATITIVRNPEYTHFIAWSEFPKIKEIIMSFS